MTMKKKTLLIPYSSPIDPLLFPCWYVEDVDKSGSDEQMCLRVQADFGKLKVWDGEGEENRKEGKVQDVDKAKAYLIWSAVDGIA